MSAEAKLAEVLAHHNLELPQAPKPQGVYAPVLVVNNLAFAAGDRLTQATFAVLVASTLAGIIGLLLGRFLLPVRGMHSASTHEAGVTS